MTTRIKIRAVGGAVGGALGAILPKSLLEELHVGEGDELHAVRTADGILLTAYDPEFAKTMESFEVIRRQYGTALRELAK
ncbi:AbrB/MazE/SpoVT family DNA-binding domain-containing protein [Candidatus Poribacteria bacterium]|nr:AbrB/MazE/SpoVT family DNA-binding domain-containing protein [Candidatus Poribacteria bacterium]